MTNNIQKQPPKPKPQFGPVADAEQLGAVIRAFRKQRHLTLEKVAGLSNLGVRFLSEIERGKETAELGKVIKVLQNLGLEIIIQPRDTSLYNLRAQDSGLEDDDDHN